nr:hypothetical protein GCM10020093_013230 [Planobispora longispora]
MHTPLPEAEEMAFDPVVNSHPALQLHGPLRWARAVGYAGSRLGRGHSGHADSHPGREHPGYTDSQRGHPGREPSQLGRERTNTERR